MLPLSRLCCAVGVLVLCGLLAGVTLCDQAVDLLLCKGVCSFPTAVFVDPATRDVYVSDSGNHRVLRFGAADGLTGASLPLVAFGQPDLARTQPNRGNDKPSASSLSWPTGLFVDSTGSLWVADSGNHRVLRWDNAATAPSGAAATAVLGQADFTSGSPVAYFSDATMVWPTAMWMDEQGAALWVVDSGDSRILRYDNPSAKAAGTPADGWLGQDTLLQFGSGYGAGRFSDPVGVAGVPGGGLVVTDTGNNRVLFFTATEARTIGGRASYVFGQPDLDSPFSYPTSPTSVSAPRGIAVAEGYVLVSTAEHRVLMFENGVAPTSNLMAAVGVLGQPNFTARGHGSSDTQLYMPRGLFYDAPTNKLWVADAGNHRVVRFPSIVLESQNRTGLMLKAAYKGRSPNVHVLPHDGQGATQPGQKEVFLALTSIEEQTPSGATVSTLPIPSTGYTANVSADGQIQQFNFHMDAAPFLDVTYSLFPDGEVLSSAGLVFTTEPSTLKLTISMGAWPFGQASNELVFHLTLDAYPAVRSIQQQDGGNKTTFVLRSATITTTVSLLASCTVDGTPAPVRFSLDRGSGSRLDLSLRFPHYASSLHYDPDFSVVLSDNGNDDSSSGPGLYPLLTLLALVFPAAFLLVGIVVLFVLVVAKRRRRRRLTRMQTNLATPLDDPYTSNSDDVL